MARDNKYLYPCPDRAGGLKKEFIRQCKGTVGKNKMTSFFRSELSGAGKIISGVLNAEYPFFFAPLMAA